MDKAKQLHHYNHWSEMGWFLKSDKFSQFFVNWFSSIFSGYGDPPYEVPMC